MGQQSKSNKAKPKKLTLADLPASVVEPCFVCSTSFDIREGKKFASHWICQKCTQSVTSKYKNTPQETRNDKQIGRITATN